MHPLAVVAACAAALPAAAALVASAAQAPPSAPVLLEELTSTELAARVKAGTATTVLLPIGGVEQNGAHIALGKHDRRALLLAQRIAQRLGDAVVAPVLAYVPEGEIDPPTQHMRWSGTISVPAPAFEATLVAAARSLQRHGLCHVVLLGDHGGYRASLDRASARANGAAGKDARGAAAPRCRVHPLPEYYRAASDDFARALQGQGYGAAEVGTHAGLADTSLMLALDPSYVRTPALGRARTQPGVAGDPARASAELGRAAADHIVDATVAAIRAATR